MYSAHVIPASVFGTHPPKYRHQDGSVDRIHGDYSIEYRLNDDSRRRENMFYLLCSSVGDDARVLYDVAQTLCLAYTASAVREVGERMDAPYCATVVAACDAVLAAQRADVEAAIRWGGIETLSPRKEIGYSITMRVSPPCGGVLYIYEGDLLFSPLAAWRAAAEMITRWLEGGNS